MVEDVIVWVLVGAVVLWIGLLMRRRLSGKGGGCACAKGGCGPARRDCGDRDSLAR